MVTLNVDTRDLERLMARLEALPEKMQRQVLSRAIGRSKKRVLKRYTQLASERMNIYQKPIRARMSSRFGEGVLSVYVRSEQIPLAKLGAEVLKRGGVSVKGPRGPRGKLKGSYLSAFQATMGSGHSGIFKRHPTKMMASNPKRQAIEELYGPNPAGEILRHREEYQTMLAELLQTEILKEIESGVVGMLKKLG